MNIQQAQRAAVDAATTVGALMRRHLVSAKRANSATQYDIKLELDVRFQNLIEKKLRNAFPQVGFLGEEKAARESDSGYRWVVDPIDGTVNFAYGIPHACVSIALQQREGCAQRRGTYSLKQPNRRSEAGPVSAVYPDGYSTMLGIVYDPFCDELWTATVGEAARLNGRIIRVSRRRQLREALVCLGFAKSRKNLKATLPYFNRLAFRVRKVRMMGAAALALTYVASGRFDAYIERGIRLWDIAAGGLILQCAGGEFRRELVETAHTYRMIASNGLLRRQLGVPWR